MPFATSAEYFEYLRSSEISLERMRPQIGWKLTLQQKLGEEFDVFVPKMPNVLNAQYDEWKIWFERILQKMNDGVIVVGHSLGGIFLAKYFSANLSPRAVKAAVLVAAPATGVEAESMASFSLPESLSKFEAQVPRIHLLYSDDDAVVPATHADMYMELLPQATKHMLHGYGHVNIESFPEIVQLIKSFA